MSQDVKKEVFLQEFFNINPAGDPEKSFKLINKIISRQEKTFENELITFKYIVSRYKEYCSWWKEEYGDVEGRFIKKDRELLEPYQYLSTGAFKRAYNTNPTNRNYYLFLNHTPKQLKSSLKEFLKSIKK